MAEDKKVNLGILIAFLSGIALAVIGILSLSLTGQVTYYMHSSIDNSLWQPQDKYINESAVPIDDPSNLKPIYKLAVEQRDQDLANTKIALNASSIIVGLIGLLISIGVFFRPKDGVLAMIKGTTGSQ